MYRYLLLILLCMLKVEGFAQKPIIDSLAYDNWSRIMYPYLTADGKFVEYQIRYETNSKIVQVVKAVNNDWIIKETNGSGRFFNNDKCYLYKKTDSDSLLVYTVGRIKPDLYKVQSFYPLNELLLFQLTRDRGALYIKNMRSNELIRVKEIGEISAYKQAPGFNGIFVSIKNNDGRNILKYVDLLQNKGYYLDNEIGGIDTIIGQNNIALISQVSKDSFFLEVFSPNSKNLSKVYLPDSLYAHGSIKLRGFTKDDKEVIFEVFSLLPEEADSRKSTFNPALVLWTYKSKLPSNFSKRNKLIISTKYKISLDNKKIVKYLSGNNDGSLLVDSISANGNLSPSGKFVLYADGIDYWSYEIASRKYRNLTSMANNNWFKPENGDYDTFYPINSAIEGWVEGNDAVIIADEFDVWKIDLKNDYKPRCLTNGYGRRNKVSFSLVEGRNSMQMGTIAISLERKIYFTAFDNKTKKSGFYLMNKLNQDPILLKMDNAMYWIRESPLSFPTITSSFIHPQKAKDAEVYLVARSTADSSQNLYVTKDFKSFKLITSNFPERDYNWMTTQLITWTDNYGRKLQGVLYKPENFDSTRKYPVIFFSYRKASINLNAYMYPKECPGCIIDIPSYVSDGYLVFTPDIYFTKGNPGKDALNTMISAAKFLSSFPFINEKKIGIQGCSFGGFTTNYIITHTNIFAAAASSSGLSDLISGYNTYGKELGIKQWQFESGGPYQLGGTLWENKEAYIENSPIFSVDKMTTPLLLMHTKNDATIPMSNAMEFFLAARRLNKKSWLLQYEKGSHVVRGAEGRDFVLRMKQFFDYYLKNNKPPKWMIDDPSELGSIQDGLQNDFTGRVP